MNNRPGSDRSDLGREHGFPGAARERVPLSLDQVLNRLKLPEAPPDPRKAIERTKVLPQILQEFAPLAESLEWQLSNLYWSSAGLLPFLDDDVPFIVNNSGCLSEHAAAVFYAYCEEARPEGVITLLEVGAGTGLFARYFLDTFHGICEQEGRDYYQRLAYHVSDGSERTVQQWLERGLFDRHGHHVVLGVCDATKPTRVCAVKGSPRNLDGLNGVICNYLLDVLPSTIVRQGTGGCEELCVRTHLTGDRHALAQYTRLDWEAIQAAAASADPEERLRLLPLLSLFEFETAFRPCRPGLPYLEEALACSPGVERIVLNHGALACLEVCVQQLQGRGMILVNDYGPTERSQIPGHAASQRFGPTSALGLNFPLLEEFLLARGCAVVRPDEDEGRSIHARLVAKGRLPQTQAAFLNRFGGAACRFFEGPLHEARQHVAAGRRQEALDCYRLALSRHLRNWHALGEIAEFVGLELRDYSAGLELARAALEHNPWFSPWLWNVLGDCLYCLEQFEEAHQAYLQAQRVNPHDPRTGLNLAYTYLQRGEPEAALLAVAVGLAHDRSGLYRDRLLRKQGEILAAVAHRSLVELEQLARRSTRLQECAPLAVEPTATARDST